MYPILFAIFLILLPGCRFFGATESLYPLLTVSDGDTYDFGSQPVGSQTEKIFIVSNSGDSAATDMAGTLPTSEFQFKGGRYPGTGGSCASTLETRSSCTIVVVFQATTVGTSPTDTVHVTYGPSPTWTALDASRNLTGSVVSRASLSISDGSTYNYGRTTIGTDSTKLFTLTNSGGWEATGISAGSLLASPFSFGGFPGSGTCSTTLAAGASCTFSVRYSPSDFTSASSTVDIAYSDGVISTSATRAVAGFGVGVSGTLDTTFATLGKQILSIGGTKEIVYGSGLQTDGKTVLVASPYVYRVTTDGRLDTSFNTYGMLSMNYPRAVLQDTSGRLLFAGSARPAGARESERAGDPTTGYVARRLSDGTLDTSFNTSGYAELYYDNGGNADLFLYAINLQTDGKILTAGTNEEDGGGSYRVDRLTVDGQMDTSFKTGGWTLWNAGNSNNVFDQISGIGSYDNGQGEKILILGSTKDAVEIVAQASVTRLNSNGTFDTSFRTDGEQDYSSAGEDVPFTPFGFHVRGVNDIRIAGSTSSSPAAILKLASDGSLSSASVASALAGGLTTGATALTGNISYVAASNSVVEQAYLYRFNAGTFDTSFGTAGVNRLVLGTATNGQQANVTGLKARVDGSLVISGNAMNGFGVDGFQTSLLADGSLDTSFHTDGLSFQNLFTAAISPVSAMVSDSASRIYAGSIAYQGYFYTIAIARFDSNGSLDTSFNTNGVVQTSLGTGVASLGTASVAMMLRTNGSLVAMGRSSAHVTARSIVSLLSNGALDTSFRTSGQGLTSFIAPVAVKETAGGTLTFIGQDTTGTTFGLSRITSDGRVDTTFQTKGFLQSSIGTTSAAYNFDIQTDGKLVVAGASKTYTRFALARYSTDGTLDTSFATAGFTLTSVVGSAGLRTLFIQTDGSYAVGGWGNSGTFVLGKYLTDGTFDTSYGTAGFVWSPRTANTHTTGVLQTNGRHLIFGRAGSQWAGAAFSIFSGTVDNSFGTNGAATFSLGFGSGGLYTSTQQNDGRVILGGSTYDNTIVFGEQFALIRIWP